MQFKDFTSAVNSNRPFYQLFYYDRVQEYSSCKECLYFSTKKELDATLKKMENENKRLYAMVFEVYGKYGLTPEKLYDNYFWNRAKDVVDFTKLTKQERHLFRYEKNRVGYCHISWFRRDIKAEEREEREEFEQNKGKIEEQGPYGGAFADWDDFWKWKEG